MRQETNICLKLKENSAMKFDKYMSVHICPNNRTYTISSTTKRSNRDKRCKFVEKELAMVVGN